MIFLIITLWRDKYDFILYHCNRDSTNSPHCLSFNAMRSTKLIGRHLRWLLMDSHRLHCSLPATTMSNMEPKLSVFPPEALIDAVGGCTSNSACRLFKSDSSSRQYVRFRRLVPRLYHRRRLPSFWQWCCSCNSLRSQQRGA